MEHRLTPGPDSVHWGHLDARLPPVLTIDPGDTVVVETVSGSAEDASTDPAHLVRPELRAIHRALRPDAGPHILTGPILVRGAEPGDMLRVEILDIALRDDWGFNITRPGKGVLPEDFAEPGLVHFSIDRAAGRISTPWGAIIPARPFFGVMATAPRREEGRRTSVVPGYFGGNMDNRELVAGSVLYLPVTVAGGLLSVGDGHAAQGDGEVGLTAVETGLTGRLRIGVVKGPALPEPFAETGNHLITRAFDTDLDTAIAQALRAAIRLIRDRSRLTAHQAYVLCSIAADIRITQLVNVKRGVHVMIPKPSLGPPIRT